MLPCSFKEVLLGVHDFTKEDKKSWQKVGVKRSFPHPCYDKAEWVNDLMLLEVRSQYKMCLFLTAVVPKVLCCCVEVEIRCS